MMDRIKGGRRQEAGDRSKRIWFLLTLLFPVSCLLSPVSFPSQSWAVTDLAIGPEDIALSNSSPQEGEVVQITVAVHNVGGEAVSQAEDIEVWLYEGPPDDEDSLRIQSLNTVTGLAPGRSKMIRARWRARHGVKRIYARLDPENLIPETDEANNQAFVDIEVKPFHFQPVTQEQIEEAIRKGAQWIRSQQGEFFRRCPLDGSENPLVMPICRYDRISLLGLPVEKRPSKAWDPVSGGIGATALAVMTLIAAGADENDPAVKDGLEYLIKYDWSRANDVYSYAMLIPALVATGDKERYLSMVQHAVDFLVSRQLLAEKGFSDRDDGGWGYGAVADGAHMQYVIYALYTAKQWPEIKIPRRTWRRAVKWIKTTQHNNGGWNYNLIQSPFAEGPYGSMTATGLMALKASGVPFTDGHIQRGIKWLERHYTVTSNPGSFSWHYYYLLSLMRAMDIPPKQETLAGRNWYEEAASFIVHSQKPDGRWVDVEAPGMAGQEYFPTTCFAVLFLKRYLPQPNKVDFGVSSDGIEINPEVVQEGKPVNIRVRVCNGGKPFEGSVPVGIYDGDPSVGGKLIELVQLTFPKGMSLISASINWKAEKPGYHRIFVKVDPKNSFDELFEWNNIDYQEMEVKGKAGSKKITSQIKRIADGVYKLGKLILDTNRNRIEIPGRVNLIAGVIEYLGCGQFGKLHESVFVLDAEPVHLYLALLRLGLKPGDAVRMRGDPRRPKGDELEITVEWEEKGVKRSMRAERFVLDVTTGKPMEETSWVFTGSRVIGGVLRAQATKSIVATYRDPDALINNPLPGGADDTVYKVNSTLIPPKGTPIKMIIKPARRG
jgi:hypothetical protein